MDAKVGTKTNSESLTITRQRVNDYIAWEEEQNSTETTLRKYRRVIRAFYNWLPEDKSFTKENLLTWRQSLRDYGYSQQTERQYAMSLNRFLRFVGREDLCFTRGRARDLSGMQFGYLTAIEATSKRIRHNVIWRCECRCGRIVELPAVSLLSGNTLSCGCLKGEHLRSVNRCIEDTNLRRSLDTRTQSNVASSGYVGVTPKRGKWLAYINYKKTRYFLGVYEKIEDAVEARAQAKKWVRQDALGLLDFYEKLNESDPALSGGEDVPVFCKVCKTAQSAGGAAATPEGLKVQF